MLQYPFRRIQDGIDAAIGGDKVHVAGGEYFEAVTMKDGINLYGGYDGNDWFAQRDLQTNETIIDANGLNDSVVHIIDANYCCIILISWKMLLAL